MRWSISFDEIALSPDCCITGIWNPINENIVFKITMYLGLDIIIKLKFATNLDRYVRNPGRDISFPIFIRKEIETRKLERKSKQKISRLIDLLYRLNDIISR